LVGESGKMKISVSITKDENLFLQKLVEEGKAANKSHAIRQAIKELEKEVTA